MLSSLGYVILALLATKPQSGYDLARQMKPPLGFLWQAKHGQIYPELARLGRSGMVDWERVDKGAGPPRRVHSLTAKGRAELADWVARSPQPKPMNDELVVKAYALRRVSQTKARALLRDELESHERRLATLEQLAEASRSRIKTSIGIDSPRFGEYAALRRAIGMERDYVVWCRWLLGRFSKRASNADATRKSRRNVAWLRSSDLVDARPSSRRAIRS